jgi:hypothetical protein
VNFAKGLQGQAAQVGPSLIGPSSADSVASAGLWMFNLAQTLPPRYTGGGKMGLLKKEVHGGSKADQVEELLDSIDFYFQAPLVHAVLSGNLDEVRVILENDPEAASALDAEKRSPLHAAAYGGFAEIAEVLITTGNARVNTKDNQWLTPLHRACRSSSEVVKLFVFLPASSWSSKGLLFTLFLLLLG